MKAIELTNVKKTIDHSFTIGPIDISIDTGCVVGLVGSNGAGKSSLLRLMMGLVKADEIKRMADYIWLIHQGQHVIHSQPMDLRDILAELLHRMEIEQAFVVN